MKIKRVLILALVVMVTIFTGCEPEPTLPELTIPEMVTIAKGYNNEIVDLMLSAIEDSAPSDFSEGDLVAVAEGITCNVTDSYLNEVRLSLILDGWVAADETEIGGYLDIEVEYYTSTEEISLNMIRIVDPSSLYFDRSSVTYLAEFVDEDSSDQAFIADHEFFFCLSLNDDGKTLLPNMVRYK